MMQVSRSSPGMTSTLAPESADLSKFFILPVFDRYTESWLNILHSLSLAFVSPLFDQLTALITN